MGKYFCEFLGVPPPPTGKDLCLSRQQQSCTQPYWGNGGTIWCLSMWKVIRVLCPKDKPACAGSTVLEKVSGCSEDKAQFYSSITSARGRGDGVSVTYSVKSTVPRPEGSSWQCRELRSWERAGWLTSDPSGTAQPPVSAGSASAQPRNGAGMEPERGSSAGTVRRGGRTSARSRGGTAAVCGAPVLCRTEQLFGDALCDPSLRGDSSPHAPICSSSSWWGELVLSSAALSA